jgi:allophanate hydrolase
MFNNIIGLKPTRGRISARGVVPACRSLDCVSIFAETASDASAILTVASGFDEQDPYSRVPPVPSGLSSWETSSSFRFGIPTPNTREFFGDTHNPLFYQKAIDIVKRDLGGEPIEFDLTPFLAVASLLYKGPWVAERYAAVGHFIEQHEKDIDPIVRDIIIKAKEHTAPDLFNAVYELERLKKIINRTWQAVDVILVPTAPRSYTIDEINAAPVERNSHLGYYTNFVNLLDLAAIAVPAGMRADGLPFSVTLIAPAFTDEALLLLGDRVHRSLTTYLGGSMRLLATTPKLSPIKSVEERSNVFLIAVVGAHLSGQPLNNQLTQRKAELVRTCRTHSGYRLFALKDCVPPKPGPLRVNDFEGPGIELEIWALPIDTVPSFIDMIPSPLWIGNICLEDGCVVKGFLVEPSALDSAEDITHTGGWRAYLKTIHQST